MQNKKRHRHRPQLEVEQLEDRESTSLLLGAWFSGAVAPPAEPPPEPPPCEDGQTCFGVI